MGWLKRLLGREQEAEKGSVLVIGALSLVGVMGLSGLAVEAGTGYAAKIRNQRVADMAALGAAVAYQASSQSLAKAQQTACDIVNANGIATNCDGTTVTVAQVTVSGQAAIQVSVRTAVPVRLAAMINTTSDVNYYVNNTAFAALGSSGAIGVGCVNALLASSSAIGVTVNGSAKISASGCAVNTNSAIQIDGSGAVTAKTVGSSTNVRITGAGSLTADTITAGGTITKPPNSGTINGTKQEGRSFTVGDPLADNADLTAAFAKIGVVSTPTAPIMPAAQTIAAGTDWNFDYNYGSKPATDPVKANCTFSSNTYTCNAGTYAVGTMTIGGGLSVVFNAGVTKMTFANDFTNSGAGLRFNAGAGSSFKFKNKLDTGSSGVVFGDADIYVGGDANLNATSGFGAGPVTIRGALTTGGSSTVTIGAGAHAFGSISVGGSGRLTVGAGSLDIVGGLATGGSTTTTFGDGTYRIGKDSTGWSIVHTGPTLTFGNGPFHGAGGIYVNGSSTLTFGTGNMILGAAATSGTGSGNVIYLAGSSTVTLPTGTLSANGAINTGGDSTITFGAGTDHSINGTLTLGGAATLGAGNYYIAGDFNKTASRAVTGTGVSIFATGTFLSSGASAVSLTAASSTSGTGTGGGTANIVFASKTTAAARLDGSTSNSFGGIFYMPNSDLTVTGAGSAGATTCVALFAKTITISGSSTLSNNGCTMPTVTGASAAAKLIQ